MRVAASETAGTLPSLSSVAEPLHRSLGLTDGEFDRIRDLLGRFPNDFELAVFSLPGPSTAATSTPRRSSERLPSRGERVPQGPGENAGVIDLGEGVAVALAIRNDE